MATPRRTKKKNNNTKLYGIIGAVVVALVAVFFAFRIFGNSSATTSTTTSATTTTEVTTSLAAADKEYLDAKFKDLLATNSETVGYVYIPGTQLDEPVVQTTDNATYLDKRFDGEWEPLMGAVFMDADNNKNFTDRLTWLFGHARGSRVPDHRMFKDVNLFSDQNFFDSHKYVVIETPEKKLYYEALAMVIVPETTAFYRTEFADDADFKTQLEAVYDTASVKNSDLRIDEKDHYVVLSTCREEDPTIRANLYIRQIPDSELKTFLEAHGSELTYQPTR